MRAHADFLIEHASAVATCAGSTPRRGGAQADIGLVRNAVIASRDGVIVYVGNNADSVELASNAVRIDASGCVVVPGFVDPHTHIVYAGDRRHELQRRLAGATYAEIAAEGGGILSTVAATRAASEEELLASGRGRLDEMLACGTTTCEAKSGYGLTTESELKQLRVMRALASSSCSDAARVAATVLRMPPPSAAISA